MCIRDRSTPPHKANILYWVAEKRELQEAFQPRIDKLLIQRTDMERVIIFVEGMKSVLIFMNCSNISWVVASLHEPIGSPNLSMYRLVDIYTSITQKEVKDAILDSMCNTKSPLRVVILPFLLGWVSIAQVFVR